MMESPFKYWRFCLACGPVFAIAYFIFWGLMGSCVPPLPATMTAAEMAGHYIANANSIRMGIGIAMSCSFLYLLWGVAVTKVMETVETGNNALSMIQIWGAGLTIIPILVSCTFFVGPAYRPESLEPSTIQLLYDMGFLNLDLCWAVTSMQMVAIGVLFLSDKRETPLLPRWLCWLCIWGAFTDIAEILMSFFKVGIFSRNGLVNFWVEYSIFFWFIFLVSFFLFKAITRLEQERGIVRAI